MSREIVATLVTVDYGHVAAADWMPGDPLPGVQSHGAWTAQPMLALKDDHRCFCEITEEDWEFSRCSARWSPELMAYWEAA